MIYALIVNNALWLVGVAVLAQQATAFHRRIVALQDARETARDQNHREHIRHLEGQIVALKVSPPTALAAAIQHPDDDYLDINDDEALAEFEIERTR